MNADSHPIEILLERIRGEMNEKLGRIEERQKASSTAQAVALKAAEDRHTSIKAAIDTFVPRKEVEAKENDQNERIDKLEANQRKAAWALVGVGTGGISFAGVVAKKLGFTA